jgi:hypothetical protein
MFSQQYIRQESNYKGIRLNFNAQAQMLEINVIVKGLLWS